VVCLGVLSLGLGGVGAEVVRSRRVLFFELLGVLSLRVVLCFRRF